MRAQSHALFALGHSLSLPVLASFPSLSNLKSCSHQALVLACVHGVGGILEAPSVQNVSAFRFSSTNDRRSAPKNQLWQWLVAPLLCYLIERIVRARTAQRSLGVIVHAAQWSDKSFEITVACQPPEQIKSLRCGDYVNIAARDIAPNDCNAHAIALASGDGFHPFSVKSGTSARPQIQLVIDVVGDWTRALQRVVNPDDQRGFVIVALSFSCCAHSGAANWRSQRCRRCSSPAPIAAPPRTPPTMALSSPSPAAAASAHSLASCKPVRPAFLVSSRRR